jgi:drug/metabolite transporter (DMT)-like permease
MESRSIRATVIPATTISATAAQRRRSILLVVASTFISAAAQVLIKAGANRIGPHSGLLATLLSLVLVPSLFAGYALYGVMTVILVIALRHGELSVLYPVIALSYIWVAILSVLIFHESMNGFKIAGIALIIAGVAVLGRGNQA